jgi:hypothetical protein
MKLTFLGRIRVLAVHIEFTTIINILQYVSALIFRISLPVGYLAKSTKTPIAIACIVINGTDGNAGTGGIFRGHRSAEIFRILPFK